MDLGNSTVKTPEAETETPTRIQPAKASPFSNGVLKRHAPLSLHHHHPVVVTYKECLKNHAASLGGHARRRLRRVHAVAGLQPRRAPPR
ncbi:zinc-finger homeodomain protein 9 [Phtheirospermum japonicum]|uniref:Zinc-finger homeodomain protein 9 n=1 Tax=Phtheirospermum japonicum TaxID=374723 RepID=A0A830DCB4_9LAMI|nr:zinc-finger homeodomain protein 9 [Phtheirospermum japonicum]